jgi:hypothetical protein
MADILFPLLTQSLFCEKTKIANINELPKRIWKHFLSLYNKIKATSPLRERRKESRSNGCFKYFL